MNFIFLPIQKTLSAFAAVPYAVIGFFLRLVIARTFFLSGQTKIEGFEAGGKFLGLDLSFTIPTRLRPEAISLFQEEYKLPLLSPEMATALAAVGEHLLPLLLVIGLATRLSAFGLLIMTLVIQFFVYPDAWWTVHAYWVAVLIVLIKFGAGAWSADALLSRRA